MDQVVTIVQGKDKNGYYFEGELLTSSAGNLGSMTELIMGLGFEYTYLERYELTEFPEKLSDLPAS